MDPELSSRARTENAWVWAARETWSGWKKKYTHRFLAAGLALVGAYLLSDQKELASFFGRVETAVIGVAAFLVADVLLYAWHLMRASTRQRNALRELLDALEASRTNFAKLKTWTDLVGGSTHRLVILNVGTQVVRDISVALPDASKNNWLQAVGWKSGEVVVSELHPEEQDSASFMLRKTMGGERSKSFRATIRAVAESGELLEQTVLFDPNSF